MAIWIHVVNYILAQLSLCSTYSFYSFSLENNCFLGSIHVSQNSETLDLSISTTLFFFFFFCLPNTSLKFQVSSDSLILRWAFVICDGLDLYTLSCIRLFCESLSVVFLKYLSDHTLHLHNPFLISPFPLPLSLSQLFMVWLELPLWSQRLQCVHYSWILAQSTVVGMVLSFPTRYNCQPYYFFAHWMTFTAKQKCFISIPHIEKTCLFIEISPGPTKYKRVHTSLTSSSNCK